MSARYAAAMPACDGHKYRLEVYRRYEFADCEILTLVWYGGYYSLSEIKVGLDHAELDEAVESDRYLRLVWFGSNVSIVVVYRRDDSPLELRPGEVLKASKERIKPNTDKVILEVEETETRHHPSGPDTKWRDIPVGEYVVAILFGLIGGIVGAVGVGTGVL